MDVSVVHELVDLVVGADEQAASREELEVTADRVRRLLGWVQSQQIRVAQGLTHVASFPEGALAAAGHLSMGQAGRLVDRATTASQVPRLAARAIDAAVDRLFAERVPDRCPPDALAKQHHLQALAVVRMMDAPGAGRGGRSSGAEVVVVLQADADGTVSVDAGIDVDIPVAAVRAMVGSGTVWPVVVRDGEVVWANGSVDAGRTRRLATKSSRTENGVAGSSFRSRPVAR